MKKVTQHKTIVVAKFNILLEEKHFWGYSHASINHK